MDPLEAAELHLDMLYGTVAPGLLLRPRADLPTPAFHLVRTVAGNRWLIWAALPEPEREQLRAALSREPVVASLEEMEATPPVISAANYRGPAFEFPLQLPESNAEVLDDAASARTVEELAWVRHVTARERPVTAVRNEAGEIVSVCHSSRSIPTGAAAGVETAPAYRGRGFAPAVVATWATAVRAEGRIPMYSTQWTNAASRAVALKLGLIAYGEDCR